VFASYLEREEDRRDIAILRRLRLRYFTPDELLRLFHFNLPHEAPSVRWPESVSRKTKYKLIGNSVNVEVIRRLIDYLVEGDTVTADGVPQRSSAPARILTHQLTHGMKRLN